MSRGRRPAKKCGAITLVNSYGFLSWSSKNLNVTVGGHHEPEDFSANHRDEFPVSARKTNGQRSMAASVSFFSRLGELSVALADASPQAHPQHLGKVSQINMKEQNNVALRDRS
jgi:hypothetical protein